MRIAKLTKIFPFTTKFDELMNLSASFSCFTAFLLPIAVFHVKSLRFAVGFACRCEFIKVFLLDFNVFKAIVSGGDFRWSLSLHFLFLSLSSCLSLLDSTLQFLLPFGFLFIRIETVGDPSLSSVILHSLIEVVVVDLRLGFVHGHANFHENALDQSLIDGVLREFSVYEPFDLRQKFQVSWETENRD